jgi:hypothetical protein
VDCAHGTADSRASAASVFLEYSPQRFTQAQLFACLVLRQFFRTDYRGLVALLEDFPELRRALKLKCLPHYSTLCYAQHRLMRKRFR